MVQLTLVERWEEEATVRVVWPRVLLHRQRTCAAPPSPQKAPKLFQGVTMCFSLGSDNAVLLVTVWTDQVPQKVLSN